MIAIDLGKRKLGIALFDIDGCLLAADTVRCASGDPRDMIEAVLDWLAGKGASLPWVIEQPVKYRFARAKHDSIDELLELLRVLQLVASPPWVFYTPLDWKGNVPKAVHHARVRRALTPAEKAIFDDLGHDACDAIALGLFHAGRTGRGGVSIHTPQR
jgi:hypothetical protein